MKRQFDHPAPSARELNGPRYWRSLDELVETPGFQEQLEREFPAGASTLSGVDRRHFFKLMAASFALGGVGLASGCRRPESNILPYGKSVEGVIPGLPLYFATAFPLRRTALPLLAETHQGRPTKLEGNPSYEPLGGASSLLAQASVLDLYDPDRSTTHTIGAAAASVEAVRDRLSRFASEYAGNGGAGLAFLAEQSSSPTRARLVAALRARFPQALWAEYEPVTDEPPAAAAQAAFGANVKPVYRFANARRVVSIDADFLQCESGSLLYARDFAKARKVVSKDDPMNRLYSVESTFTLTGGMADHRLRLPSSHMLAFAAALAAKVGVTGVESVARGLDFKDQEKWLTECAADLNEHRGECLVVAGAHQPAAVHAIVYAINARLGNVGRTVEFVTVEQPAAASITDLAAAVSAGRVQTLFILGGNPAYNAPADVNFPALAAAVRDVVRYGYYVDETSRLAGMHIAAAHYLESWGDGRTVEGTIVPIQPMILPLFNGLTEIEVLARLAGETTADPYSLVFNTLTANAGADAPNTFRRFLHDGVLPGSAYPRANVSLNAGGIAQLLQNAPAPQPLSRDNLEVRFVADHAVDDGRFANNGWLQEVPNPVTKISWDNAILISPRLAQELGVYPKGSALQVARVEQAGFQQGKERAFIGVVTINGRTVRGPMHIQPGLANYTIVLPLGYGRTVSGRVGQGAGQNFYPARTSDAPHFVVGARIEATKELFSLANTQEHWSMEGRDIVREANLDEFREHADFVHRFGMESHAPANLGPDKGKPISITSVTTPRGNSLYEHPTFEGVHQWGMSVDLNTCFGCNACVVACQAENNIPIVGKDQVLRGREMHWLRLDRYYSDGQIDGNAFGGEGNKIIPEDPQVVIQPMACVHCEMAPCEVVCPVNATVHDEEGLNVMAYNRCIGTRYCANNCPWKVRRFNYFDYNQRRLDQLYLGPLGEKGMPELLQMRQNPDVTVRMRGVMEKCTYCVQRIQQAKIAQKVKARDSGNVEVPDGTIKTACQQACPVDCITFGNIKDPESAVSKAKAREHDYAVLGYLNARPRTTYLGKLRNPNPKMPDYYSLPLTRVEYNQKSHPSHGNGGHGGAHGTTGDDAGHPSEHEQKSTGGGTHSSVIKSILSTGGLS
jgi:MoCo/4Fe-4S cofactor protein with predicted Tat translocation signal